MKRRARKEAAGMAMPSMAGAAMPPDCNVGMVANEAERPRNRAADLAKAEAFYLSLEDLSVNVGWEILHRFRDAVAAAITKLRLRP